MGDSQLVECLSGNASDVVRAFSHSGLTIACAESLTAGMVSSTIADVPGASSVLRGGAVTYVNEIKEHVLGVSRESIERYTEVSHQVAREMARGARELFGSDVAVSLTGYAGPGGGTELDPVGTVYLGIADKQHVSSWRCTFDGDRSSVRMQAAAEALELCLAWIRSVESA